MRLFAKVWKARKAWAATQTYNLVKWTQFKKLIKKLFR